MKSIEISGIIREGYYGENYDALFIGDHSEPLAVLLTEGEYQITLKNVSVKYWISETKKTKQEIKEDFIKSLSGCLESSYKDRYSDITGYLWTDENLAVGNHDLMNEIRSNIGKYIHLEINIF